MFNRPLVLGSERRLPQRPRLREHVHHPYNSYTMNRKTMRYALVALGAGLISLASCSKKNDPIVESVEVSSHRSILEEAHTKGLFLKYEDKTLSSYSRARTLDAEKERILREFLSMKEVQSLIIKECHRNPLKSLLETQAYNSLPQELQYELRKLASDEDILAIWKEGLEYIEVKRENASEARQIVYSQLLGQGPQHAAGSKQVLKAFGAMAFGAWTGGGLPGAIAGLGGYLLSIW